MACSRIQAGVAADDFLHDLGGAAEDGHNGLRVPPSPIGD